MKSGHTTKLKVKGTPLHTLDSTLQPIDMLLRESTFRNLESSQAKCVFPPSQGNKRADRLVFIQVLERLVEAS
jgi:hypothetical protein